MHEPEAVYKGIFALRPGCTLAFQPGNRSEVRPYWQPSQPTAFTGSRRDALEAVELHEAVVLRLRSDVAEIVCAPPPGFEMPVAQWMRADLKEVVGDLLPAPDSRVAMPDDQVSVREFVHGTSTFFGNHPQAFWSLFMLEMFLRAQTPQSTAA